MGPARRGGVEPVALSVVLPAHNEVGLLGATVTSLLAGLDDRHLEYELVIVENGSTDGTLRLARVLAAQLERIRVLWLPNGDYGAALAAGFAAARGEVIAAFDVDYYDLSFLDAALGLVEAKQADLVLASKRAPGARDQRPLARRVLTAGFAQFLRVGLDLPVSDAHGMKVFATTALAPVIERCAMRGSLFDVEMALRASRAGRRVAEIPAAVVERRPPRSPVAARTLESVVGVLRLRRRLAAEHDAGEADAADGA